MFRHKLSALLNLYHTQIHVCSFSKMELPWNCTIPRQHAIQFSFIHNSIPTHPKSGKFPNHSNSKISIPKAMA